MQTVYQRVLSFSCLCRELVQPLSLSESKSEYGFGVGFVRSTKWDHSLFPRPTCLLSFSSTASSRPVLCLSLLFPWPGARPQFPHLASPSSLNSTEASPYRACLSTILKTNQIHSEVIAYHISLPASPKEHILT